MDDADAAFLRQVPMRVRDRLTAAVVALAVVLTGLGSAPAPALTTPATGASALASTPTTVTHGPATGTDRGTSAVASRPAYPDRSWAEPAAAPTGDPAGVLAYGDGSDDPVPTAPAGVAEPVTPGRVLPAHRSPVGPLPPRGPIAARAPPAA
ncbi:hypothetical protein [Micromonospora sp. DT31]|uniref:hypothetical protein n=1 Tax=Micromonospora sp. DT31 TaxID=3393434 RepID=UPI003CF90C6F